MAQARREGTPRFGAWARHGRDDYDRDDHNDRDDEDRNHDHSRDDRDHHNHRDDYDHHDHHHDDCGSQDKHSRDRPRPPQLRPG